MNFHVDISFIKRKKSVLFPLYNIQNLVIPYWYIKLMRKYQIHYTNFANKPK